MILICLSALVCADRLKIDRMTNSCAYRHNRPGAHHFGNNRLVTDASGTILQTNHYDPYGESLPAGASVDSGNPYKWGNKEYDVFLGSYDFGARYYTPASTTIPRWTTMDPLCEKYYSISPYAYCDGNPVRFVDPTGSVIEESCLENWNLHKERIKQKYNGLQQKLSLLQRSGKIDHSFEVINKRIKGLEQTLETIDKLEKSEQTYSLSMAADKMGGLSYNSLSGIIMISIIDNNTWSFVHEITHAGQFETGDIAFVKDSGETLAQDVYDEQQAYLSEAYFLGTNPNDITIDWIHSITTIDGKPLYSLSVSNTASIPINIWTPLPEVITAYNVSIESPLPNVPFYKLGTLYYKESLVNTK